ncbi:ribosome biogenesis protein 15-like [Cotesia glomerata]|uniref:RRM domain-containing protein n=1 Tax=Cotesia glomerata TaxID=32391 RepID=A0AAV7IPW0_COTGL|nr:ribosome biogenesis protein 15-like [Cotesia glomerata]KAH0554904.1 hypothetical protein KQX54_013760 [Cotesia glomerata]
MKTNNNKMGVKSSGKTESTLSKAVKNVKEILIKNTEAKEKKQKKLSKSSKEENIIKLKSEDSPAAAAISKKSSKILKKLTKSKSADSEIEKERGVVYIGHLPHGFYEEQMRVFFSKFGEVTNVRVSRSKVSGKSRGYGFIEFAHAQVAKIAAESMNNYLMFGRLVKTEYIPPEKQHDWYFRGLSYTRRSFPKLWNRRLHVQRINGKILGKDPVKDSIVSKSNKSSGEENETRDLEVRKKLWSLNLLASRLKKKGVKIDMKLGDVSI